MATPVADFHGAESPSSQGRSVPRDLDESQVGLSVGADEISWE